MENKLDIRAGYVVRLKPLTVDRIDHDGDLRFVNVRGYIDPKTVESIISRPETPDEKIARLEAELAKAPRRIEWSGGKCPVDEFAHVIVWFDNGTRSSDIAKEFRWDKVNHSNWVNIVAYMVLPE